ncbi:MAG: Glutamine--fructose-6-phosphate aminotransferase [isomerizing] [Candidatus Accumulibacter regalis]|jgi:glucosamine--fructose-6-phosphate aminotransferase (isomerizing)|uniref:Glutamine--fructose-6-phosphate aminotransferase [isomerizing] n=1 Tax=Accumulibacter regalis TaxID=522306 RepID=A0A011Q9C6_ACCRE|nr:MULTISPECIES: glutamine--fructose-6-phosphate transaminase (isomerizing) [unclassified Candidatus Accumulibacter]EXI85755.1 MAG: Glutamine--fructose-6-phosphate aminotransferase [isomerizing] [Candidatus Accumulibacter regalis]MQM35056.1 glutamine--fructose-6-phosphate transaminase (isomerizing) [Candidatus Accumulibacter phosphatis]MBN8512651.1 glutamine--fructose-6-phosphate transaminase (isomerizing) [Accumulibacter sp.]MBO3702251.1 glutamine--fructose-6-phosphate transaminase (isomerizin
MCGIVAAVADRNIIPVLLEGLRKLEYRGYDSAGLALINASGLQRLRSVGRVAELTAQADGSQVSGHVGIAHTRWATHGIPSERNAHPHISEGLAVVHNGIIENHEALRARLKAAGYEFTSETDTEVVAHLIAYELKTTPDFLAAVCKAIKQLHGAYAIAVLREADPGRVVVAREGSPLLLGLTDDGCYAASDASALLQVTRRMVYLENGDCAELTRDGYRITRIDGTPVDRAESESQLSADAVELGHYRHYMQKEIFEQPVALANTLEMLGTAHSIQPGLFGAASEETLKDVRQVLIIACGTSYHAGLVARYWLESIAGIPCSVEVASEYRYRDSVPDPATLLVTISQSGETADTLAALHHAKTLGMLRTLCICNVPESSLVRENSLRFITRAGPEIGVASTKAFTTQLAALYLLTLVLAKLRGRLDERAEATELNALRHLPIAVTKILEIEPEIREWSEQFSMKQHALFLGRGRHYPIAMEGALKLKEISYIHAEAYPAGELKHGPLALVDRDMPVIAVAPNDALIEKLKSNLQEVRARGGELYVFADADSEMQESDGIHVLHLPEHYGALSALLHVVPLQLLAYHVALVRGTDVDKPRNLAKSVTVE